MNAPCAEPGFSLRGQMLIAMPSMIDANFGGSVVYVCEHNVHGALGLIVNFIVPDMHLSDLLSALKITARENERMPVHLGGPVQTGQGFVLHSLDYRESDCTLAIDGTTGLTMTPGILAAIAQGAGPQKVLIALGCAGWGPGQLDQEILANGWLHGPADDSLLFSPADNPEEKHAQALARIGVEAGQLSSEAGSA